MNRLAVALNDLAVTFDAAIRKAATRRIARALCKLRAEAEERLRRAADGYGRRSTSQILDEVLDRLRDLVGGGEVIALAKRASGPGHREAAGLVEMTREQKTAAFIELAAEVKAMVRKWRPLFRKRKAEDKLDRWYRVVSRDLAELARVGDSAAARARMN